MAGQFTADALRSLLRHRVAAAKAAGHEYIRNPTAFEEHLVTVACASRLAAEHLAERLPARLRPDPLVCFLAGAWHDAGKIYGGDDYHELTGALELLTCGSRLGLAHGPNADGVLRAAARAILPHFALREQLQDHYAPTTGRREHVPGLLSSLERELGTAISIRDLLPTTLEARVLIYCDVAEEHALNSKGDVWARFEQRWRELAESARRHDPAIVPLLPAVQPRIRDAYATVAAALHGESTGLE
jgi:HD domain